MLTQQELKELVSYDHETGIFKSRVHRGKIVPGSLLQSRRKDGYIIIGVGYKRYLAHRLAWLYVHGKWPAHFLDHINGNPSDNSIANLREATNSQNNANSKKRKNKSGVRGVRWHIPANKWLAEITKDNRTIHLGLFTSIEAASSAYQDAAREYHGEFTRR